MFYFFELPKLYFKIFNHLLLIAYLLNISIFYIVITVIKTYSFQVIFTLIRHTNVFCFYFKIFFHFLVTILQPSSKRALFIFYFLLEQLKQHISQLLIYIFFNSLSIDILELFPILKSSLNLLSIFIILLSSL